METAAAGLIGGKQGIPPQPFDQRVVIRLSLTPSGMGFNNGRIIAERLNEAGYQMKAGKARTKDIYSGWRRQGNNIEMLRSVNV